MADEKNNTLNILFRPGNKAAAASVGGQGDATESARSTTLEGDHVAASEGSHGAASESDQGSVSEDGHKTATHER